MQIKSQLILHNDRFRELFRKVFFFFSSLKLLFFSERFRTFQPRKVQFTGFLLQLDSRILFLNSTSCVDEMRYRKA